MSSVTVSEGQLRAEALAQEFSRDSVFPSRPGWPVTSNWASKLAHPCIRWLYHNRVDWGSRAPRNWKGIGELGDILHDKWKRDRMAQGYQVIHAEVPLSSQLRQDLKIGGKIDGRVGKGAIKPTLYEFKSMNEHDYDKINTWDDIRNHKRDYIRSYAGQIQIYLYDQNEEVGFFVIMNKSTLEWKWITVYLDYDFAEWLLKRAELVNKSVDKREPPDRIPYGPTCKSCEFAATCLPDIKNEGLEMIDNEELGRLLNRRRELEGSHQEFEEIDKGAKEIARRVGKEFLLNQNWKVEVTSRDETRIDTKLIPIEERARYEVTKPKVTVAFVPIGKP